jgi:LAO/AO transport system kinase
MPDTAASTPLTVEQQEELENCLHKASKENRILCSSALAIARSLGIPTAEVGNTANKLNIKISKCQLGCF